jgi:hypothetical protein
MRNHVVKHAEALIDIADIKMTELDVRKFKLCDNCLACLDLARREVNADEPASPQSAGYRD